MSKYFFFFIFLSYQSSAMKIAHGGINELSKPNILKIIKKAEKLGIEDTNEIKTIRSWWNGKNYDRRYRESIDIVFKPHIESKFHAINYSLICRKEIGEKWSCQKKEHLYIRFDVNQEINIVVYKQADTDIDVLVEVARTANNLRPMTWKQPISQLLVKPGGDYIVTFGSYASCARRLTIRRDFNSNTRLYSVDWENFKIDSCFSIGGYIDIDKLYIIYENGKWVSD